jgi:hypothetical protein
MKTLGDSPCAGRKICPLAGDLQRERQEPGLQSGQGARKAPNMGGKPNITSHTDTELTAQHTRPHRGLEPTLNFHHCPLPTLRNLGGQGAESSPGQALAICESSG